MPSEFAKHLSKLADPDGYYTRGSLPAELDAELAEVREVLDGLRYQYVLDCWCDAEEEEDGHKVSCQRARALYERLEIK